MEVGDLVRFAAGQVFLVQALGCVDEGRDVEGAVWFREGKTAGKPRRKESRGSTTEKISTVDVESWRGRWIGGILEHGTPIGFPALALLGMLSGPRVQHPPWATAAIAREYEEVL
jgi:hypothetical protein